MGSLTFKMIVGTLAGTLAWVLIEPTKPPTMNDQLWGAFEIRLIMAMGAFVGLAVGGFDGWSRGSRLHLIRGLGFGLLFGIIGATFGYSTGGQISQLLFGGVKQGMGPLTVLTRVVALTPIGLFLGLGIGASSLTVPRMIQGAIGGAIGAAIGAAVFDFVGSALAQPTLLVNGITNGATGEVGPIPRAIWLGVTGGAIGLFIGLVERFSRRAWVRLQLGRNEGKEWSLDTVMTYIGRSEAAQIPLFGDMNIAPAHAVIQRNGGQYVLTDGGSPIGTYVNGQRIQSVPLMPGAMIQIGGFQLQFMTKGSAVAYTPTPYAPPVPVAAPTQGFRPAPMPTQMYAPSAPVGQPTQMYAPNPAASMPTQAYASPPMGGGGLVALDGPLAGQRFALGGPIELGRESASIPMGYDTQSSRRHASVAPGPAGMMVSDLGSTNGTFVNGQRVQTAPLRPGDLIKVGSTTFRYDA